MIAGRHGCRRWPGMSSGSGRLKAVGARGIYSTAREPIAIDSRRDHICGGDRFLGRCRRSRSSRWRPSCACARSIMHGRSCAQSVVTQCRRLDRSFAAAGCGRSRTLAQCVRAPSGVLVVLARHVSSQSWQLTSTDLGWTPDHVLSLDASPPTPEGLDRPLVLSTSIGRASVSRVASTTRFRRRERHGDDAGAARSNTIFPAVVASRSWLYRRPLMRRAGRFVMLRRHRRLLFRAADAARIRRSARF